MAKQALTSPAGPPAVAKQAPYYLERAHIKDFRSIRDASVDFKPGLNIIIGPNGAGKTNFTYGIQNGLLKPEQDFTGSLLLRIQGREPLTVAFSDYDAGAPDFPDYLVEPKRQLTLTLDTGNAFTADSFHEAQLMSRRKTEILVTGEQFLTLIPIAYGIPRPYQLADTPLRFSIHGRTVGTSSIDNSFFAQSFSNSLGSSFSAIKAAAKKQDDWNLYDAIEEKIRAVEAYYSSALAGFLKSYSPISNLRLSSYNAYDNATQQQIIVQGLVLDFKVHSDWLPFNALSSGTQRLFYIISEIIGSFIYPPTVYSSGNESAKIILLEEPELGIHPDQLHLLLRFLREQSKQHQLIITTHSPQVLDMLEEDELDRITICELHKTKGTQFRKLKKSQIQTAQRFMREQGLFLSDYWRYGSLEKPATSAR